MPGLRAASDYRFYDGTAWVSLQGLPGSAGVDGSTWFFSNGVPLLGDGVPGDKALDFTTGNVYEKTDPISWTLRGNMKGPKGDPGTAGTDGADGAAGTPGTPGTNGADGADGADGKDGTGVSIQGQAATTLPTQRPDATPLRPGDMFLLGTPLPVGVPASAAGPAAVGDGIISNGVGGWTNVGPVRGPKGDKGDPGTVGTPGIPGGDGTDGKSAYQLWLDAGNVGTQAQFLAGMVGTAGTAGTPGTPGADGNSIQVFQSALPPVGMNPGDFWILP